MSVCYASNVKQTCPTLRNVSRLVLCLVKCETVRLLGNTVFSLALTRLPIGIRHRSADPFYRISVHWACFIHCISIFYGPRFGAFCTHQYCLLYRAIFNMITFIPPTYVAQQVTRTDMNVASICWGFTLGFGFLTTWEAMRQSLRARDPLRSTYVWMIWLELLVCLAFSIICWIHLDGGIPPRYVIYTQRKKKTWQLYHINTLRSFAFYFCICKPRK